MSDRARLGAYLSIVGAVCVWGTWPLWLRSSALPPLTKAVWSLAFIGAFGLGSLVLPAVRRARPSRRDLRYLLLMGLCAGANQLTYFAALELTTVARAALAHYLAPVLVAAVAPLWLREPRDRRVPLAMAGAVGGLALLLGEAAGGPVRDDALGVTLGLCSAVCYAAVLLCAKGLERPLSPLLLVGLHCALGALVTAPYALATGAPLAATAAELGWLALASLVAGFAASALFYRGLRSVPAQHAAVLTYLEPLTSALLAWLLLGETLGWRGATGGALVLGAGLFVVARRR